ncbi:MAG TPA: hypothetical protein PKW33_13480 [Anaerolineaceae bacterium]|nr:hypothetical protein [Anaerolineaceae bacterium]HPN52597.1 hypothetical protein [Anaerolineaceae bacterium]
MPFGSELTGRLPDGSWHFYHRFMQALLQHEDAYAANLEKHFIRHLPPW